MDGTEAIEISRLAESHGVTRICHLTPLRNLVHLACDDAGLLSLHQLAERSGDFNQQDLLRLDNHPDHISCSIQYPNGWYLRQRRLKATPMERLFPDWVCLAIKPHQLWTQDTRVCVRNAATSGGALVEDVSPAAFKALYRTTVFGSGGKEWKRSRERLSACPTDDQAEVLVRCSIPLDDIETVIVATESNAKSFYTALAQIGAKVDGLSWAVAPVLFTARPLSSAIAAGQPPDETPWEPDDGQ